MHKLAGITSDGFSILGSTSTQTNGYTLLTHASMHTGSGFGTLTVHRQRDNATAHRKTIVVAPGLPALDRTVVELILAELFVDLAELPPAKGLSIRRPSQQTQFNPSRT